ncbi:uncharacterized protein WM277_007470 [Molossus nigricans]
MDTRTLSKPENCTASPGNVTFHWKSPSLPPGWQCEPVSGHSFFTAGNVSSSLCATPGRRSLAPCFQVCLLGGRRKPKLGHVLPGTDGGQCLGVRGRSNQMSSHKNVPKANSSTKVPHCFIPPDPAG